MTTTAQQQGKRYRVDCWSCGGSGFRDGECSCLDDTCCCRDPEPPMCSECKGNGFLIVTQLTDDNFESAVEIEESRP